ncbi:ATP-binding cassette domain-containing protein [Salibacterium aidingense]|uniref:ATP-binding cassette domain-containing protein n=1 Tax=Salibacterium aidingense TaxID=384933 RepID=UPI00041C8BD8|nr:ATP-binding cassette domain-containing protein [Salibacterium aidingense]
MFDTIQHEPVLSVQHLSKRFGPGCSSCDEQKLPSNICAACGTIWACKDMTFDLFQGEILGIVGESGSGKSTLMRCLHFEQEATRGAVYMRDYDQRSTDTLTISRQEKQYIKDHVLGLVYQNPWEGLRMDFSSGGNIAEKLIAADYRHVRTIDQRAEELLEKVDIPIERMSECPRYFSGGMQQRVQISKALANQPPLLFLDEVTTGLDLSVQAKVLDLIRMLQREFHVSILIVSHDLSVIRMLADRTMVLKDGDIIETGLTDQILEDPQHPYTQLLVQSLI